jgi:hypothetical protein
MPLFRSNLSQAAIAVAMLIGISANYAQAQTTLRWKFKEGERLDYVMDQKMVMKMNVNGMLIENSMSQVMDFVWDIKKVDSDGVAEMVQKIERIRFRMDTPVGPVEYDSKEGKPPEGPIGQVIAPIFDAMAGSEFSMKMDSLGEVSDVKVPEKLLGALQGAPGAGQLGGIFSEDGLKHTMNQSAIALPKEPVSKGKTWNKKMELNAAPIGTMKIDNSFAYQGTDSRNGAKVEKIEVKVAQSIEPLPDAMIEVKIKEQESKGAVYFDNAVGRMTESEMKQKMLMELNFNGMIFEQDIDQTMTVKLQPKSASE